MSKKENKETLIAYDISFFNGHIVEMEKAMEEMEDLLKYNKCLPPSGIKQICFGHFLVTRDKIKIIDTSRTEQTSTVCRSCGKR